MNSSDDHQAQRLRIRDLEKQLQLPPLERIPASDLSAVEKTLRYLATIDGEPTTTLAKQLITHGIELPSPDALGPEELTTKLREVIFALSRLQTYLYNTNHLDDARLYRYLWEKILNEPSHELDETMGECACHIDIVGDGSEESELYYLQYYADGLERDDWQEASPEMEIPPHCEMPNNRDDGLPRPGRPGEESVDPIYLDPLDARAQKHMNAAKEHYLRGDFDQAHAELDLADKVPSWRMEVAIRKMELYMEQERWDDACTYGEALCDLDPEEPAHFINYADALFQVGNASRALHFLELGPPSLVRLPIYHYNRGVYELYTGDPEPAVEFLKFAFAMDSSYREAARTDPDLDPIRHLLFGDS